MCANRSNWLEELLFFRVWQGRSKETPVFRNGFYDRDEGLLRRRF